MSKRTCFLLMNKDTIVLAFSIVRATYTVNYEVDYIQEPSLVPRDMRMLKDWIESRFSLGYRYPVETLCREVGISEEEELIEATNCVSLRDTYWVKGVRSHKFWSSVSLYSRHFNRSVGEYSLSGEIKGKNLSNSPDLATDGNFPKCWRRSSENIVYMYKAGSSGALNAGNEPYSEFYASKIADRLGIRTVKYDLSEMKGKVVSRCRCITSEKVGLISYRGLTGEAWCDFGKLLETEKEYKDALVDMLLLDYVICNVDRHYGNIGFLIENSTNKVLGLAPLYDHNLSCVPYYIEEEDGRGPTLEQYIEELRAKDGRTWEELFALIDSNYVREKLKLLRDPIFSGICKRDRIVNDMVAFQVKKVL